MIIEIIKGGVVAATLTGIGAGGTILAEAIGEASPVTVGLVLILASGLWYFATSFQRMRDDIRQIKSAVAKLERDAEAERQKDEDD